MTAPRLEIDLGKVQHNARRLVGLLRTRGISVTGVTKATLGSPEVARALLSAGVTALGDSRIENLEAFRLAGIMAPRILMRSPMPSQADRVVAHADVSFNTELEVISMLSGAALAAQRTHGIVLMVELGDLREGIMPDDLEEVARQTLHFPNITLLGIGANLACHSGVAPDSWKMSELSELARRLEEKLQLSLRVVSGGNSANLEWALGGADTGRINDLRLGESILLGRETLRRRPIDGLHTDAITLVAEVIESKLKPSLPWGEIEQTAFGEKSPAIDRGQTSRAILAIGRQDTDPEGLQPPPHLEILGASSDHLIADSGSDRLAVGAEVKFQVNYSALLRSMTSPYVAKRLKAASGPKTIGADGVLAVPNNPIYSALPLST